MPSQLFALTHQGSMDLYLDISGRDPSTDWVGGERNKFVCRRVLARNVTFFLQTYWATPIVCVFLRCKPSSTVPTQHMSCSFLVFYTSSFCLIICSGLLLNTPNEVHSFINWINGSNFLFLLIYNKQCLKWVSDLAVLNICICKTMQFINQTVPWWPLI